jgi:O-antigen ligase
LAHLAYLRGWLSEQPTRWVVLAVWFFGVTTLLSTVFSASLPVSLWGEVPGQDGLSAFTLGPHLLLFAVITTHLKTRAQLWRLLGAVAAMGVVVAGLAILQHYGHDVLGALESSGGGQLRVTSTVGNAVFAGALMLMPIAVSLMLGTMMVAALGREKAGPARQSEGRWRSPMSLLLIISLWTIVLSIQFLGLIFTLSRGPWLGTIVALLMFLLLNILIVGWRVFGWASLILGLAGLLTGTVLQSYGSGLTPTGGAWLIAPLVLAGILTAIIAFRESLPLVSVAHKKLTILGRFGLAGSVKARLVGVVILGLGLIPTLLIAWSFFGSSPPASSDETGPSASSPFNFTERFASVSEEVLSGSLSNRGDIWKGSLTLMRDHPWFKFDELSLRWLRPLVGYGPDLFRYTYLLVSVPLDASLLPAEPDHAHNFLLNQGVEQGILGLLSAAGIFLAAFGVAGYQLIKRSGNYSQIYKLAFIGLVATISGRFIEQ